MLDELSELIDSVSSVTAIVEGKRDRASLERLGFVRVVELDAPLFEVVERFDKGETVQILTDLDREGRSLYQRLRHDLTQRGVRIDNRLREALFGSDLTHIEGLDSYLERNR